MFDNNFYDLYGKKKIKSSVLLVFSLAFSLASLVVTMAMVDGVFEDDDFLAVGFIYFLTALFWFLHLRAKRQIPQQSAGFFIVAVRKALLGNGNDYKNILSKITHEVFSNKNIPQKTYLVAFTEPSTKKGMPIAVSVEGKPYHVAFTDSEQVQRGPGVPSFGISLSNWAFYHSNEADGLIVNPFDPSTRRIVKILEPEATTIANKTKSAQFAQTKQTNDNYERKKSVRVISDEDLLVIFNSYFAPNTQFFSHPGSSGYEAYFKAIDLATQEMLDKPALFADATGRKHVELITMCSNRIPGFTNMLICGLIFSVGQYVVNELSSSEAGYFSSAPNCVALFYLLIAQKIKADRRSQIITIRAGLNVMSLKEALKSLEACDPNWKYSFRFLV